MSFGREERFSKDKRHRVSLATKLQQDHRKKSRENVKPYSQQNERLTWRDTLPVIWDNYQQQISHTFRKPAAAPEVSTQTSPVQASGNSQEASSNVEQNLTTRERRRSSIISYNQKLIRRSTQQIKHLPKSVEVSKSRRQSLANWPTLAVTIDSKCQANGYPQYDYFHVWLPPYTRIFFINIWIFEVELHVFQNKTTFARKSTAFQSFK